jgi:hypothetical protein
MAAIQRLQQTDAREEPLAFAVSTSAAASDGPSPFPSQISTDDNGHLSDLSTR